MNFLVWWLASCWAPGYYFSDVAIYDTAFNAIREGMHVLVEADGTVSLVATKPIPKKEGYTVVKKAQLLPHYADFYSLIQERGLGFDRDLDPDNQVRMARYLRQLGVYQVRDPVFPAAAMEMALNTSLEVLAQRGYVEMPGGPAETFALVLEPGNREAQWLATVPPTGPVTFWWTDGGSGDAPLWPQHGTWLKQLMAIFHERGQKVGAYIQDASAGVLQTAHQFKFDFYEGMPATLDEAALQAFPELVWIPLVSLNDRRYCATYLKRRLEGARDMGLYAKEDFDRVWPRLPSVRSRLADRCRVWQKRRTSTLKMVSSWAAMGRQIGVGSAGGHLFALSGDLRSELDLLNQLDVPQGQILEAFFENTQALLGGAGPYLKIGKPAHFIVYRGDGYWGSYLGKPVAFNFVNGRQVLGTAPSLLP